jgi:hypothetical protein
VAVEDSFGPEVADRFPRPTTTMTHEARG